MSPSKYKEYGQIEAYQKVAEYEGKNIGYHKINSRSNSEGKLRQNLNFVNIKGDQKFSRDFKGRGKYLGEHTDKMLN